MFGIYLSIRTVVKGTLIAIKFHLECFRHSLMIILHDVVEWTVDGPSFRISVGKNFVEFLKEDAFPKEKPHIFITT